MTTAATGPCEHVVLARPAVPLSVPSPAARRL